MPLQAFPSVLRQMVEAELAAGNEIEEIAGGFPAPPMGECLKLKRAVSTPLPEGVRYQERNSSLSAGEYTDSEGHYFILNPPLPPQPEPDMDAIRAAANAPVTTAIGRFEASMATDYEKWHDGTGYDVGVLEQASPEERKGIEKLLLNRAVTDWRAVEALAALNSIAANRLLKQALKDGDIRVRVAVLSHAPKLVSEAARAKVLVEAIQSTDFYGGLTQALLQVEQFHPPKVIDALLRGVLERAGDAACHFAAMLMFVHNKAKSSFDWTHRPFFLKFNTEDMTERRLMFEELCGKIEVDASKHLKKRKTAARPKE